MKSFKEYVTEDKASVNALLDTIHIQVDKAKSQKHLSISVDLPPTIASSSSDRSMLQSNLERNGYSVKFQNSSQPKWMLLFWK